jgi:hypothetical protein
MLDRDVDWAAKNGEEQEKKVHEKSTKKVTGHPAVKPSSSLHISWPDK